MKNKPKCSICGREIKGSVNPEKILTCSNCFFALKDMEMDLKVWYRDRVKPETARSIESFIYEVDDDGIEDRSIVFRKRIGKGFGHFKTKSLRTPAKRITVAKSGAQGLLLRTHLDDMDSPELPEKDRPHARDYPGRMTDDSTSREITTEEGHPKGDMLCPPVCQGAFCAIISQKVSWCHKIVGTYGRSPISLSPSEVVRPTQT